MQEPKPVNEDISYKVEDYAALNECMAEQEHKEEDCTLPDLWELFGLEYDSDQSRGV